MGDRDLIALATELVYQRHASGAKPDRLPGYEVVRVFDDVSCRTGFHAVAFASTDRRHCILAIRGSEDRRDIVSNIGLGVSQYLPNRAVLVDFIGGRLDGEIVAIAGHSLGGGLSQYLAYDVALAWPALRGQLVVQTHNGFGGIYGITQMHGRYDPVVVEGVTFRNFRHPDDPVSRLGGHVGGVMNIPDPDALPNDVFYAHSNARFLRGAGASPLEQAVAATDDPVRIPRTFRSLTPHFKRSIRQLLHGERPLQAIGRLGRLFRMVPPEERDGFFTTLRDVLPFSRLLQRVRHFLGSLGRLRRS